MKNQETGLTVKEIQKEGIELKLTQNDLIEMLVQEKVKAIDEQIQAYRTRGRLLVERIEQEKETASRKVFDGFKDALPEGYAIEEVSYPEEIDIVNREHIRLFYENSTFENYTKSSSYFYIKSILKLKLTVTVTNPNLDLKLTGFTILRVGEFFISSKLLEDIKRHNADYDEFCKTLPANGISLTKMTKIIKSEFTKQILSKSSAEFKKKLKAQFGIIL
jgi:uncharacterized protein (UPF0335 family)